MKIKQKSNINLTDQNKMQDIQSTQNK